MVWELAGGGTNRMLALRFLAVGLLVVHFSEPRRSDWNVGCDAIVGKSKPSKKQFARQRRP
jgi:hypothetical protein